MTVATLHLEDGTVMQGISSGAEGTTLTEVVFQTSMNGYQEVWTDPAFAGQLIVMTYPLSGNIGINREDIEAIRPHCTGVITHHVSGHPSHWRWQRDMPAWFREQGLYLLTGLDTRMLTRHLRRHGTMKALLTTETLSADQVQSQLSQSLPTDQVHRVSRTDVDLIPGSGPRIVVVDYGVKTSLVHRLITRNCDIIIVPYDTSSTDILKYAPDGVIFSNGPGNPQDVADTVPTVRALLDHLPVFGIGLGHQLFALACGAATEKLPFGHRGGNHPVQDVANGKGWITEQNHGYTVTADSLADTDLKVTHVSLNDGTVEGLRHRRHSAFSIQFDSESIVELGDRTDILGQFLKTATTQKRGARIAQTT